MHRRTPLRGALALGLAMSGTLRARAADEPSRTPDAARKEGTVTVYSSLPTDDMTVIARAFEARHGLKVQSWRAASRQVLQRVVAETRAGRQEFDVVETGAGAMETIRGAGALRPLDADGAKPVIPAAAPAHRHWTGTRLVSRVCVYNTRLVQAAELPARYQDLAHPRWRERLAFEPEDSDWFGTLHAALGEAEARSLFDAIAANGLLVRKGHSLIVNLVAAGELPFAMTAYGYRAEQTIRSGAPLAICRLQPAIAALYGIGIGRHARRPAAAALFVAFMQGEGQEILASRHHVPVFRTSREDPREGRFTLIDPELELADTGRLWRDRYEAFLRKGLGRG